MLREKGKAEVILRTDGVPLHSSLAPAFTTQLSEYQRDRSVDPRRGPFDYLPMLIRFDIPNCNFDSVVTWLSWLGLELPFSGKKERTLRSNSVCSFEHHPSNLLFSETR